jgi:hypothetical protein
MALVACKECSAQIFVGVDICPQCGVPKPCVSDEEEQLNHEKQAAEDAQVAEILRLGAQKKAAYVRLDQLEGELFGDGVLMSLLRALFPSAARKAKREEFEDTQRKIYALRGRMDELWDLVPAGRLSEIHHLWSIENTTSLSQLRGIKK